MCARVCAADLLPFLNHHHHGHCCSAAMARHGVLKHTVVWKHFHLQASVWPVAGVTRKFSLAPGSLQLNSLANASDLDALIEHWTGGIFQGLGHPPVNGPALPPSSSARDSTGAGAGGSRGSQPRRDVHGARAAAPPPLYVVIIKSPFSWIASMMKEGGMAEFILRTEYNVLPVSVDAATPFAARGTPNAHPASQGGPYGQARLHA